MAKKILLETAEAETELTEAEEPDQPVQEQTALERVAEQVETLSTAQTGKLNSVGQWLELMDDGKLDELMSMTQEDLALKLNGKTDDELAALSEQAAKASVAVQEYLRQKNNGRPFANCTPKEIDYKANYAGQVFPCCPTCQQPYAHFDRCLFCGQPFVLPEEPVEAEEAAEEEPTD